MSGSKVALVGRSSTTAASSRGDGRFRAAPADEPTIAKIAAAGIRMLRG